MWQFFQDRLVCTFDIFNSIKTASWWKMSAANLKLHERFRRVICIIWLQANNRRSACQEHSSVQSTPPVWQKASNTATATQTGSSHRLMLRFPRPQTLRSSPSLCLCCSVPRLVPSLSLLQNGWMQRWGWREGGRGGRSGEVNEIPMRCQGVLAVRCGEWEKRPEGRGSG